MKVSKTMKARIIKLFREEGKTVAEIAMLVGKPIPVVMTIINQEVF